MSSKPQNILECPPSVQKAIARIERHYDSPFSKDEYRNKYNLDIEVQKLGWGNFYSVAARYEGNDCAKSSLRGLVFNDGGHFIIGGKGAIKVCATYRLFLYDTREQNETKRNEHMKMVARSVRGKVSK